MKYTFHVPTQTYGYLEITGEESDLPEMEKKYNEYAEKPIQFKSSPVGIKIKAFCGGEIFYDDVSHTYSWNGEKYLSGSEYAKSFEKPFDGITISEAMAKRDGGSAQDLQDMWAMKSVISTGYGTALHSAMEMYGLYKEVHPTFKDAVEGFYATHDSEKAVHEAVIVDHATKRAGTVDQIVVVEPLKCIIRDWKTGKLEKPKLDVYTKQLEFYSDIMVAGGWEVLGREIWHWDGIKWTEYKV